MKTKKFFAAALALLLLVSLCPAALAAEEGPVPGDLAGMDGSALEALANLPELSEEPAAAEEGHPLRNKLDPTKDYIITSGYPISVDNLIFLDDCVLGEEVNLCICEAVSGFTMAMHPNKLPKGCKTEQRKEAPRLLDSKTGRQILEEEALLEAGLPLPGETLPLDGKQRTYLYLTGTPTELGSYTFVVYNEQLYFCCVNVVKEKAEEDPFSHSETGAFEGDEPPAPTPTQTPVFTPTQPPQVTPTQPPSPAPTFNFDQPTVVAPTVTVTGPTSCRPGETVVLEAHATGSGTLRYQWYNSLGVFSAPVEGANGSIFMPDTDRAGTYSYFCRVTGSGGAADSDSLMLNVVERQLVSVTLDTPPTKLKYVQGEALDTAGLRLLLRYDDGTSEYVTNGFSASPARLNTVGSVSVTVTYKGLKVGYLVNVTSLADAVRGIVVISPPAKTSYQVGDSLDASGLTIRVYTTSGSYYDLNKGFSCSPTQFTAAGRQAVTVDFVGKTSTFTVDVEAARRVTAIWIQTLPVNRSYAVGDSINTTGLVLQVRTNNGTETVTSGFSYSPRVATRVGTQTVTVIYEGQSATYTVDVREAAVPRPTATRAPTPTPAVTAPAASAAPQESPAVPAATSAPTAAPTPTPVRRNTGVSTLVKVLFAVAVLALAGLIGYVLYLRSHGFDEEESYEEPSPSEKLHALFSKDKKDGRGR